jgi:hypothetical protein
VRRFPRRGRQAGERSGRKAASVNKNPQARGRGCSGGGGGQVSAARGLGVDRGRGRARLSLLSSLSLSAGLTLLTAHGNGWEAPGSPPAQLGGAASSVAAKMKWTRWKTAPPLPITDASSQITCPPPPTCSDISPADHRCQRRRAGKNGGGLAAAAAAVRVYRWVITSIVTIHLPLPYTVGSCACCAIQKMDPMLYSQFKRYD